MPHERRANPPSTQVPVSHSQRGVATEREAGDQVADGPGLCSSVEEARASTGYLAATPTSHRLGVASLGLGQLHQASREGAHYGGQPSRGLAAKSQGPALKSPGGMVPSFSASPQQVPLDASMLSKSPWTASTTPDWLRHHGSPDPPGTAQWSTSKYDSPFQTYLNTCITELEQSHIQLAQRLTCNQPVEKADGEAECVDVSTLSVATSGEVPPANISIESFNMIDL